MNSTVWFIATPTIAYFNLSDEAVPAAVNK
jgi:hypothetical protein